MLRLGIAGIGAIAGDYIGLIVGGKVRDVALTALLLLCKQAAKIFQTICKKETALKRVLRNLLSAISFAQIWGRFFLRFPCSSRIRSLPVLRCWLGMYSSRSEMLQSKTSQILSS